MDKVLLYLLKKKDFVSGEEISENLSISRTAVWKHMKMAKENGFEIESVAGKGYRIKKFPPDRLISELIYSEFSDIPCEIIYLKEVDSTNDYAKRNIANLNDRDYLIITDKQTKGRGRFDRVWESSEGKDLTFSLILHPAIEIKYFYNFTIMASLAVYETLKFLPENEKLKIKWPNDLYYENKKLCGILSEMISEEAILKSLIIGVGINVNSISRLQNAISLHEITGKELDRHLLLSSFLKNFYHFYSGKKEWEKIFAEWKKNLKNLGEIVKFRVHENTITGKFIDVSSDGTIVIETDSETLSFYSGEFLS
ncbi:MAG: biotin--[acetyl-CoA-carboxylase] ligase [Brevinematia bacterium]